MSAGISGGFPPARIRGVMAPLHTPGSGAASSAKAQTLARQIGEGLREILSNNKSKQLACHQLSSPMPRITMITQIVCFGEVKASNMSLLSINYSKIRDVKCLVIIIKNQWGKLMGHILVKRCESLE